MATATKETIVPRKKQTYNEEIRPRLKDELELSTVMQVPSISKITLNMGVGEAKTEAKALDSAIEELTTIAGQRAQVRKARKSIAGFKIRDGMPIGARVTLRGDRMWEFLDRLVSIALPADPRLPRPRSEVVRRARQLLARHPRADHLPGDQLRRHRHRPGSGRDDHDHGAERRARPGAPQGTGHAVRHEERGEQ